MKHIAYITGTRADYGLMRNTLCSINNNPEFKLSIIATGMHVMSDFGNTIDEIKKDGFDMIKVNSIFESDDKYSMAKFTGNFILELTNILRKIQPDIILLVGDRAEMLSGAVVGTYLGIAIVHIHGGEVTSTVDEPVRHAITKLANIHFAATKESARRIIKMGENKKNVYVVGAPGLDHITEKLYSKEYLVKKFWLDMSKPFAIVLQHPVSTEFNESGIQMKETIDALLELNLQSIILYPNADAGGKKMIKIINDFANNKNIQTFRNIERKAFLSLMKFASVIIGNSSAGIIEASSFMTPVVNIGSRQEGRQRTFNVIDVGYNKKEIITAVKKAIYDRKFKQRLVKCKNPYGDGKSADRINKILTDIRINKELIQKKMAY